MYTEPLYGTSQGTIGQVKYQLKITMNGRQANWNPASFNVLQGPDILGTLKIHCRQEIDAFPDTDCGDWAQGSPVYQYSYNTGTIYGNKLNNDSSEYYAHFELEFQSLGNPNPNDPNGVWDAPDIFSHYWGCSGSECTFPAPTAQ